MKSVTLKPFPFLDEDADKKLLVPVEAVRVNYKRTDRYWMRDRVRQITLVKVGRRVHFSEENDTDAILNENANIALGIKTAARAFQDALDGKKVIAPSKAEAWGGSLRLVREGSRIAFTAPCGATGTLTVREAEKVVAYLQSL